MRVAYVEAPEVSITVNLIHTWKRGDIEEPAMSASSGPKPYTRNHVFAIFERYPAVATVLMVNGEYVGSVPFLLVTDNAGLVFDMAGKQVLLEA